MDFADATENDLPFLREIAALFKHGPDALSVKDWKAPGDVGIIGLGEDGHRLGAAWYRRQRVLGAYPGLSPLRTTGEVFIGVLDREQRRGFGTELLEKLMELARADRSLNALVATISAQQEGSIKLFRREGFSKGTDDRWTLGLRH